MQYHVKFKKLTKEKATKPVLRVSAPCVSEAWATAERYMPPGFEVVDVIPEASSFDNNFVQKVG
jgi:hypothetical protein